MQPTTLSLIYTEEKIASTINEMANTINTIYQGKSVVVICVLKGAFMFFSDIAKRLSFAPQFDFIRIASYGDSVNRKGELVLSKDIELSLQGKHVLLIEDIVDTGHSVAFLFEHLRDRGAVDIKIATLLNKTERREIDVPVHFSCFTLENGFLVGYGLDYGEKYRELPAIYELTETTQ